MKLNFNVFLSIILPHFIADGQTGDKGNDKRCITQHYMKYRTSSTTKTNTQINLPT